LPLAGNVNTGVKGLAARAAPEGASMPITVSSARIEMLDRIVTIGGILRRFLTEVNRRRRLRTAIADL
jgi:hypothetical protein